MASANSPVETKLPTRGTGLSSLTDDEAVSDIDPTDTAGLLLERLQAWKHACGYLENYITATEKVQKTHSKEYEKILKSVSDPLKEGHHFDQALGGVAGLFENIRSNTQGIATSYLETEKTLKGQVLPILARLHSEIKSKSKEIQNGAAKSSKAVAQARNSTQKHIELLGQHTAAHDSAAGKVDPLNDPYVVNRSINHRLHKQVLEENNNRQDLITVQDNFKVFEAHVVQTFQQAMTAFLQTVGAQADRQKAMYSDMAGTAQRIPPEFEWDRFFSRNQSLLIDPSAPKRDMSHISFPNQNHNATKPLISGTLERKSRNVMAGYKTGFYAVTASKYLHQFDDDDDFRKDPTPEISLYLPDCVIGAVSGEKFNVKGKDTSSKGKMGGIGGKLSMSHEFNFKAHTPADAEKWWSIIKEASGAGHSTAAAGVVTSSFTESPTSPTNTQTRDFSGQSTGVHDAQKPGLQTQNLPPAGSQPGSAVLPGSAVSEKRI
ncbi:hypothetical protein MMC25_006182 [Agyrium rufum]|nr:hypothetical protein [Agyrium rufum]